LSHGTTFNQPGEYSLYQHLRRGSIPASIKIKWSTGELVRRGEILGQIGQSGNVGAPHLPFSFYWYVRVPPQFAPSTPRPSFHPLAPRADRPSSICGYVPAVPPARGVITRPFALANYYDYLHGTGPMVFRPQGTPAETDAVSSTPFSP